MCVRALLAIHGHSWCYCVLTHVTTAVLPAAAPAAATTAAASPAAPASAAAAAASSPSITSQVALVSIGPAASGSHSRTAAGTAATAAVVTRAAAPAIRAVMGLLRASCRSIGARVSFERDCGRAGSRWSEPAWHGLLLNSHGAGEAVGLQYRAWLLGANGPWEANAGPAVRCRFHPLLLH